MGLVRPKVMLSSSDHRSSRSRRGGGRRNILPHLHFNSDADFWCQSISRFRCICSLHLQLPHLQLDSDSACSLNQSDSDADLVLPHLQSIFWCKPPKVFSRTVTGCHCKSGGRRRRRYTCSGTPNPTCVVEPGSCQGKTWDWCVPK